MTVCSSKEWENDHRVDGRDPSQCLPTGIRCSSSFTTLSLEKIPPRKHWVNPAAVLSAAREPASLPHLWPLNGALQPPEISVSVLVLLMEEISCGIQGELSEQDSLNISRLNETNPRER